MNAPQIVVGYLAGTVAALAACAWWARRRPPLVRRCLMCNDARCRGGAWCKYWPRNWSGM